MTDCKNCKYTDEYCASGDCTIGNNNLTEQWKKGELTQDFYYVKCAWADDTEIRYVQNPECGDVYEEIIAPVPSWESWKKHKDVTAKTQIKNCDLEIINKQLKDLLKEWVQFETEENPNDFTVMSERMSELANKTKEVLK